ncbi:MAG: hypothetical protein IPM35_07465 [Myxococcales bacterium]|nr:hypothetical protein [Myxococcales bacterium]
MAATVVLHAGHSTLVLVMVPSALGTAVDATAETGPEGTPSKARSAAASASENSTASW